MTAVIHYAADNARTPAEVKLQVIRIRQGFGRPLPPR